MAAILLGGYAYLRSRPEIRRPGEELPDITRRLARDLPESAPQPRFTDVTSEAGLGEFVSFAGERTSQLPEDMGAGVAWGDFDDDGDDDLFLVSGGGSLTVAAAERERSRLYENLGDGSFREVTAFPETRIVGMGAAWGDYDLDGRLDLAVTGYNFLALFHNDGDGAFVRAGELPEMPGFWAGVSWADFDNDRDPDLYVSGYVQYVEDAGGERRASEQYGKTVPYTLNPASFEPERNLLFENLGDGRFREIAPLVGVSNPEGRSLGALWHDFDDDGRLDLYVANDISDNALYLNRGDTFEDASLAAWVADYRGAMGLAAADWNRDGDDDLFVTHWLAQENALYDSRLADLAGEAPAGTPRLMFSDLASPLGLGQVALQAVGWGTEFADFDGDGWLDLVVANGSTLETDGEPRWLKPQAAMLFWNRQGEYFHDLAPSSEILATPRVGRGLATSDYDGDGDVDLLMLDLSEGVRLLRNDMQTGHWLELRLRSRTGKGHGSGHGSTVTVRLPGAELRRSVTGASYLSQSSRALHFGLGGETTIEGVTVEWLGGESQDFEVEADAAWELFEGDPEPRRILRIAALDDRQRVVEFWKRQRAAMDAIKVEGDIPRATRLLREALELDPRHEDSRYYLANCLAAQGEIDEALDQLGLLRESSPLSHRAHRQWGIFKVMSARSDADLEAAQRALERSLEINREETGSLQALGEVALLRGDHEGARRSLELVSRTNPKAVGAFFLRGYLEWREDRSDEATRLLRAAVEARGEEWKPEGAVAEGDVVGRMHREVTPLSRFWEAWEGSFDLAAAFAPVDAHLALRPEERPVTFERETGAAAGGT